MHIVHVMNWYIPGMGYQENYLPAEQKRLGHDVEIVTSNRLPPYQGFERNVGRFFPSRSLPVGKLHDKGVPIYRLPCIEIGRLLLLRGLKKKIVELDPDVIQLHGSHEIPTLQTLLSCRRLRASIFIDDHSYEAPSSALSRSSGGYPEISKKVFFLGIRALYKMAGERVSGFMPVNPVASRFLQSRLGIRQDRIHLVPLGVNTDLFNESDQNRKVEHIIDKNQEDSITVVFAGKFHKWKDLNVLLHAARLTVNMGLDIKVLLVGDGPREYLDSLRDTATKLNISERLLFHEFVKNEDLPMIYAAADIGCWPGNPSVTAIEAAAVGLPVIVPEDDDVYRILLDNKAAIGFTRGSCESLAQELVRLANDRELRRRISMNACQLIKHEMSWARLAEKTIDIYLRGKT